MGTSDKWSVIDSLVEDYEFTFRPLLEGRSLASYLDKDAPVAIDLLASPAAIFDHFRNLPYDSPKLGISVSKSSNKQDWIQRMGIKHIQGDLKSGTTWGNISKELEGRKANLILERGWFGLKFMPNSIGFFHYAIQRSWEMLSDENGTLFAEFPETDFLGLTDEEMTAWTNQLKSGGINAAWDPGAIFPMIRLTKTYDSPKNIHSLGINK